MNPWVTGLASVAAYVVVYMMLNHRSPKRVSFTARAELGLNVLGLVATIGIVVSFLSLRGALL